MAAGFPRMRRGVSEDEIKLVDEEEEELTDPITIKVTGGAGTGDQDGQGNAQSDQPSVIQEETHNVPFPLSLKQRIRKLRTQKAKRRIWWMTILGLGILCILAVSVPLGLWSQVPKESCLDFEDVPEEEYEKFPYIYIPGEREVDLCYKGDTKLAGTLGINHKIVETVKVGHYKYTNDTDLMIKRPPGDNYNCLRIEWSGTSSSDYPLQDCYKIEDTLWYGGYETYNQKWPINGDERPMTPFLPHDYLSDFPANSKEMFGPVLHPIWLSSNGTGILVDEGVPLSVSIGYERDEDEYEICLQALPFELNCVPGSSSDTVLSYTICVYETISETWEYFRRQINHPSELTLSDDVFLNPIWSTWAEFKTDINAAVLNDFYDNITLHGYHISQLEIDDGYSKAYGDLSFDEDKFLPSETRALSQKVPLTAWVHPFVNPDSEEYLTNADKTRYFLPGGEGNSLSLVQWWHECGAVVDFLNPDIFAQQTERLQNFVETYNLTSLKFDAGEVTYLPQCVPIHSLEHHATFSQTYVSFVDNQTNLNSRAEVRVGYFTQHLTTFVRILDRESSWNSTNGLRSIIPTVLSLAIAGYSYVIPDMIGGNGVVIDVTSRAQLDPELYIRWVQLNVFLPVMQFSIPPWRFDDKVINHVREMIELHRCLVPVMNIDDTALPIVKPLWWASGDLDGEDRVFWDRFVNEEFVIANESVVLLIAPVLEAKEDVHIDRVKCNSDETPRTVYFPQDTKWKRVFPAPDSDGKIDCVEPQDDFHTSGQTTFCVNLYETLYFRKVV